jgi:hypothetical protein
MKQLIKNLEGTYRIPIKRKNNEYESDLNYVKDFILQDINTSNENVINPLDEGLVGDGTTDDDAAFTTMLAKAKTEGLPILLPANKTFLLSSTHDITDVPIIGTDFTSVIKTVTNDTLFETGDGLCYLRNFKILGEGKASGKTSQVAVNVDPTITHPNFVVDIDNMYFYGIGGKAIQLLATKGDFKGGRISNSYLIDCNVGYIAQTSCEYVEFINLKVHDCTIGGAIYGGNNDVIGGVYVENGTGIQMRSPDTNGEHSSIIGVNANHNTSYNIDLQDLILGQQIIGCNFFAGDTRVSACKGIMFSGCTWGTAGISILNSSLVKIEGFYNTNNCTLTTTGTTGLTNELIDIA